MIVDTIIYTYKKINKESEVIQKNWITKSIESAQKLNYKTILYTNDKNFSIGLNIDESIFVEDNSILWDSLKIKVLEDNKNKNYFLSDSDVIFKNKIPFDSNIDIYFDGYELNWHNGYKQVVNYTKEHNLFKNTDFKLRGSIPVFNIGILKINNDTLLNSYIINWRKCESELNKIYKDLRSDLKIKFTPLISQYMLSTLSIEYQSKHFTLNSNWPFNNLYYNHFVGDSKNKKNILNKYFDNSLI